MSIDPTQLPDDTAGFEWPEDTRGWHKVKFSEFRVEAKPTRTWFLLQFDNGDGVRASLSQNLFAHPDTDGERKANQITLGKLKQLFAAFGLPDSEMPAPSPREIAKALNAYEGEGMVDAFIGPDGRGYNEAQRFRKASESSAPA